MPTDPINVQYIYKCRLCGEEMVYSPFPIEQAREGLEAENIEFIDLHDCPDGSIGIADLQGARVEKME